MKSGVTIGDKSSGPSFSIVVLFVSLAALCEKCVIWKSLEG
jgi:hypothetical protein